MLNFRNTNIFFILLLAVTIGYAVNHHVPIHIYLLLFFIYSLIVFWGCYYVGSNFFIRIVCSASTDEKQIAISFDDGPALQYTPAILEILKQQNVFATFFCIGKNIAGNEELFQQVYEEGHLIGNHSFSHHFWFDMYGSKKMLDDIKMMDEATQKLLGIKPRLFRPPYGVTNPNLKKAIIKGNYIPVGWSVRSMDTVTKNEDKLMQKIRKGIRPGAVFLFHDTSKTMLNILPQFIQEVKDRGYSIERLDKMLNLPAYA